MKPFTTRLSHAGLLFFLPLCYFWKKSRKATLAAGLIVIILLSSCFQQYFRTNTTISADAATLKRLQNTGKTFIVHSNDNKNFGLANLALRGDTLEADLSELTGVQKKYLDPKTNKANVVKASDRATTLMEVHLYYPQNISPGQTHVTIPLAAIDRMDVYEYDLTATSNNRALSWVGIGVVTAAAITMIAFAIACGCPQVSVNNSGEYEFKSGVYSGAVYSTLERTDYLGLDGIQPVNDKYLFRVDNAKDEEQFINRVQLMSVQHPAGLRVLVDRHGKIFTVKDPVLPVKAVYNDHTDISQELKYPDARYYSFNSKPGENGLSAVHLGFDKPAGATRGKLIVHAGNSPWSGYIYREFTSLFGNGYEKWRKQQEQLPSDKADQWQTDQGLYLKVFVETEKGWQYADYFPLTGNTASREMLMELDLGAVKTGRVNIRIESSYLFWNLDKVGMDFSPNGEVSTWLLDPSLARKNDGSLAMDELSGADKKYLHLTGNDYVSLEFPASEARSDGTRTLFLVSSGYYHSLQKSTQEPNLGVLMKFREKGAFDKFSRTKFANIEASFAKAAANAAGSK